jgi:tetratricopeptide (TPR) repeat protein
MTRSDEEVASHMRGRGEPARTAPKPPRPRTAWPQRENATIVEREEQSVVRHGARTNRQRGVRSGAAEPSAVSVPPGGRSVTDRSVRKVELAIPPDVTDELTAAVGRKRGHDISDRMAQAVRAYERDRYLEAVRITRSLAEQVPESAAARELHGLVCYRLGRWREASKQLQAAKALSGDDPSQLPVIMDCQRALGKAQKVEKLWEELRSASPTTDVLAEGRMVLAAHRADRGELDSAIELLVSAGAARSRRHPAERHLRQWYVLADLYERAGDLGRARELFARVADADPGLADAARRLADLGRTARRTRRGLDQRHGG